MQVNAVRDANIVLKKGEVLGLLGGNGAGKTTTFRMMCGVEVPVCWEEHLSKAEILELLKISHRRFYMRPKFLARQVLSLSTGPELKRLAQGALSLVKLELLDSKSRTAPV